MKAFIFIFLIKFRLNVMCFFWVYFSLVKIGTSEELSNSVFHWSTYQCLKHRDQLSREIEKGNVFRGFREGPLSFRPTYKYDVGTDNYDTSPKVCLLTEHFRVSIKILSSELLFFIRLGFCVELIAINILMREIFNKDSGKIRTLIIAKIRVLLWPVFNEHFNTSFWHILVIESSYPGFPNVRRSRRQKRLRYPLGRIGVFSVRSLGLLLQRFF